jgi:hypothetical protein
MDVPVHQRLLHYQLLSTSDPDLYVLKNNDDDKKASASKNKNSLYTGGMN